MKRTFFKFVLFGVITIFLSELAYAGGGSSQPWVTSRVELKCEPTGAGLVYATTGDGSVNNCTQTTHTATNGRTHDTKKIPQTFNIFTKPADATMYKFMYWECTKREGDYGVSSADKVGTQKTAATTTVKVAASTNNGPDGTTGSNTGADGEASSDRGIVNAIWVAHYEQILFYDVTAVSNNDSWGSVEVIGPSGNNAENKVGDQVTLYARTTDYYTMFRGWKRNGEWVRDQQGNIIRDVPYTFTVTEQNKGEYVAQFENGYEFLRIKNRNTGHYISSQQYYPGSASEGELGLMRALSQLVVIDNLPASLDDQGTIARLTKYPRSGSSSQIVHEIEIRGFNTNQFYTVSEGIFLQMSHGTDNTYDIGNGLTTAGVNFHLVERNNAIEGSTSVSSSLNYLWDFEGIDKDLTTKENYYTPGDLIQDASNGLWYTTHRAAWNTKFDTNEITAYLVTGVDEEGVLSLTEVTGGIIPAGVPVLLECQSNDVTRNVMIPTLSSPSFTATSANVLKTPNHYYPGEAAPEAAPAGQAYYQLGLTDGGRVGFVTRVTNTSTGMNGNRGYWLGPDPVMLKPDYETLTLAQIEQRGVVNKDYKIADQLVGVLAQGSKLLCKDQNNVSIAKTEPTEGQVDYLATAMGRSEPWDQSNWVLLDFGDNGTEKADASVNQFIKASTVMGTLTDVQNYTLAVKTDELVTEGYASYEPNTVCTVNFLEKNLNVDGGQGAKSEATNQYYYFLNPKVLEYLEITYAVWDGTKFVVPAKSTYDADDFDMEKNQPDFDGAFAVDWSFYEHMPELVNGWAYRFHGVVQRAKEEPRGMNKGKGKDVQASGNMVVCPIDLTDEENVVTAVEMVKTHQKIVGVDYYNVSGLKSHKPHQGINIVVTRYADGRTTAQKMVY